MPTVRLVHWNVREAGEKASILRDAGYDVIDRVLDSAELKSLRDSSPDAIIIDLSRLPSHGRDVAVALRTHKKTRHIPLVFTEGETSKVSRVQALLPDATYTSWNEIRTDLKRAIFHPPENPVVPATVMAGYSGTPLPRKLGIKPDAVVLLIGAPEDFEDTLGELPPGVTVRRKSRGPDDLILWFPKSEKDLRQRIRIIATQIGPGGLWIAWPKKSSGISSDLSEQLVRSVGLDSGLVDYKICAIDAIWSGLKFAVRKK